MSDNAWRTRIPFLIFVFLVFLDQLSKWFLPTVLNSGLALSLLKNFNVACLSILLGIFLVTLYLFWPFKQAKTAQAIFFAGAVSNFLDRIFFAGVRDCLSFFSLNNNLADYYITLALIWIFYANYLRRPRRLSN